LIFQSMGVEDRKLGNLSQYYNSDCFGNLRSKLIGLVSLIAAEYGIAGTNKIRMIVSTV